MSVVTAVDAETFYRVFFEIWCAQYAKRFTDTSSNWLFSASAQIALSETYKWKRRRVRRNESSTVSVALGILDDHVKPFRSIAFLCSCSYALRRTFLIIVKTHCILRQFGIAATSALQDFLVSFENFLPIPVAKSTNQWQVPGRLCSIFRTIPKENTLVLSSFVKHGFTDLLETFQPGVCLFESARLEDLRTYEVSLDSPFMTIHLI